MSYCTVEEFTEKYQNDETAELCSLDSDSDLTAQRTRIEQSIEHAGAEINAILGMRYQMPPSVSVPLLNWASLIITRENLHKDGRPDTVNDDYERVIARLIRIADGKEALIDESGDKVPGVGEAIKDNSIPVYRSANYTGNMRAVVPNFGYTKQDFYSEKEPWL